MYFLIRGAIFFPFLQTVFGIDGRTKMSLSMLGARSGSVIDVERSQGGDAEPQHLGGSSDYSEGGQASPSFLQQRQDLLRRQAHGHLRYSPHNFAVSLMESMAASGIRAPESEHPQAAHVASASLVSEPAPSSAPAPAPAKKEIVDPNDVKDSDTPGAAPAGNGSHEKLTARQQEKQRFDEKIHMGNIAIVGGGVVITLLMFVCLALM